MHSTQTKTDSGTDPSRGQPHSSAHRPQVSMSHVFTLILGTLEKNMGVRETYKANLAFVLMGLLVRLDSSHVAELCQLYASTIKGEKFRAALDHYHHGITSLDPRATLTGEEDTQLATDPGDQCWDVFLNSVLACVSPQYLKKETQPIFMSQDIITAQGLKAFGKAARDTFVIGRTTAAQYFVYHMQEHPPTSAQEAAYEYLSEILNGLTPSAAKMAAAHPRVM